ncbi:MAG: hypothetical protein ACTSRP_19030 [Candidatus Helarchaeota archaeon]
MNAYREHRDAVLIIKSPRGENNPLLKTFRLKKGKSYLGLKVVIPYDSIKDLSFPALFTGLYRYAEGKRNIGRMSRPGYFLDLTLEFDEKVKEKLIAQHETLTRFFNKIKKYLKPDRDTGLVKFTVNIHKESGATVMPSKELRIKSKDPRKITYKVPLFDSKSFDFSIDPSNPNDLHDGIASIQFYLLAFPGMFLSIYSNGNLVLALNRAGFQTGVYMSTGLAKTTENKELLWRSHGKFNMEKYDKYAEEYRANLISELGNVMFRHNMGLEVLPLKYELHRKMLWFCWQKCVKPTLDTFLQKKLDDVLFELTLDDLGSTIEFNNDKKYNEKDDIISLDASPFNQ